MARVEAQGTRLHWDALPASVRALIAEKVGSPVVRAENQPGGFSPGVAARCVLADGRRCFIKAVSPDQNPDSPRMYREEAAIAGRLPAHLPVPRLQIAIDDGWWIILVFDEVDGSPPPTPWTMATVATAFSALDGLTRAATPCPLEDLPGVADRHRESFGHLRRIAGGDAAVDRVDEWTRRHLDLLAELEAEWEAASVGASLLHTDVRADNLLVRADGMTVFVDWPNASVGAGWIDKLFFMPSVGLDGGPSPSEVEARLQPLAGTDSDAVNRVLAALTGYFTVRGTDPDPPGLPTLRAFQRAQGAISRAWLASRLRLDPPAG
jgi:aminoglycoside phosphotransferase (APT) family kinase protein